MNPLYWEDVVVGTRRDLGSYTFTEEEIIRFGRKYDPQSFHIDPEAAKHSMFGGLIASGWHTAAIWMKLAIAERERSRGTSPLLRAGVSPGFEDMKWLNPVRPGMTIRFSSEITGKKELASRPELGLVLSRNKGHDEDGDLVFRFTGKGFVQRRPKA
jgi:acyl dehydratase